MENDIPTFRIGICMAGAVSAGAYTAGVIDYLLEALDHWEKAKRLQEEGRLSGVPKHNFVIEVLGGASAGGMTAAVASAAFQQDFKPVSNDQRTNNALKLANPFYNSWVNLTEKTVNGKVVDMMECMLSTDDIERDGNNKKKEVRSGFNSTFIKEVADNIIGAPVKGKVSRPYVAEDAEVFTTITNLRGFDYKVDFRTTSGTRSHLMKMHRDYAFFRLHDSYSSPIPNTGRIPLNFEHKLHTEELKQAAMSTGAFPAGLESRNLIRDPHYIRNNKYLNLIMANGNTPNVNYTFLPDNDNFETLNVDGGVINNEPYEITQQLLDDRIREKRNDPKYVALTSAGEFESLVLMIDPFPNDDAVANAPFIVKKAWKHVLPSVFGAMRGQLMMKDEQIKRAYLSDDYTRFLIMPERSGEKYTIACGSLGGFGGFFSKKFREHDFYLGRRNCQRFLDKHFTAPQSANNPILAYGYKDVSSWGKDVPDPADGKVYLALLPDIRVVENTNGTYSVTAPTPEDKSPYPQIELSYIMGLKDKFEKRIKCLFDNIGNVEIESKRADDGLHPSGSKILTRIRKRSWFGRNFTQPVTKGLSNGYISIAKSFGKGAAADFFIDAIIVDMEKRGLIKDDVK